ncbi:MAG: hypothetical protein C6W55_01850 [Thermobacillus sp.]|uniref:hypothetical protein n=1 Tax=Thermobacillus sp. TaxID=2108467 RepID=UPI000E364647|nr:hypothetical protein [Thermobacillus sp.]REK59171.1 MAG: hypothetical protein C6W55_01850 [Thermobacillus sp.]
MRMRGFVAGGLIGIAAGIILSRRKPGSVEWFVRRADQLMTSAKHRMIEQVLNRRFGAEERSGEHACKSESGSSWNTIRSLINADARVKHEAERILTEAGDAASEQDKQH